MTRVEFVLWLGKLMVAACFLALFGWLLGGCTTTFHGVCAYQPIGMTDSGLPVLAVNCETVK
jgi:hypothetical protein